MPRSSGSTMMFAKLKGMSAKTLTAAVATLPTKSGVQRDQRVLEAAPEHQQEDRDDDDRRRQRLSQRS